MTVYPRPETSEEPENQPEKQVTPPREESGPTGQHVWEQREASFGEKYFPGITNWMRKREDREVYYQQAVTKELERLRTTKQPSDPKTVGALSFIENTPPALIARALGVGGSGETPYYWQAEKMYGKEQQKAAAITGEIGGTLATLSAFRAALTPLGTAVEGATRNLLFPAISRIAERAAVTIPTFAGTRFLKTLAKQQELTGIDLKVLTTETLKGVGWGAALSAPAGVVETVPRVLTAGGVAGTYRAIELYAKDRNISPTDAVDIGLTAIAMSLFEMLGAKQTTRKYKQKELDTFLREKAINKAEASYKVGVQRGEQPPLSRSETRQRSEEFVDALAKLDPKNRFGVSHQQIMQQSKMNEKLPTRTKAQMQRIDDMYKSISTNKPIPVVKNQFETAHDVQVADATSIAETAHILSNAPELDSAVQKEIEEMEKRPVTTVEEYRRKVLNVKTAMIGEVDIEYPFRQIGADATGFAIKAMMPRKNRGYEMSLLLPDKYFSNKAFTTKDYADITLYGEALEKTPPKHIEKQVKVARQIFKQYEKELKKMNQLKNLFPFTNIEANKKEMAEIERVAKEGRWGKERKARLTTLMQENEILAKTQFMHIPYRIWFGQKLDEGSERPRSYSGHSKNVLASMRNVLHKRKTIRMADLLETGAVTAEDLDIRKILSSYIYMVENIKAEYAIIQSAKKDGLIRHKSVAPEDFIEVPARFLGGLEDQAVNPLFADYLERYYTEAHRKLNWMDKTMSMGKMMQFNRPDKLFMYNLIQHGMLRGVMGVHSLKYLKKAFNSIMKHDEDYWNFLWWGGSSTPYAPPFKEHEQDLKVMIQRSKDVNLLWHAMGKLNHYRSGVVPRVDRMTRDLYQLSWDVAWKYGDRFIRMISYYALLDQGYTPQAAAQIAASFHGDYASVPMSTRKFLNRIFFTPTFKIVMTKLYGAGINSGINMLMGKKGQIPKHRRRMAWVVPVVLGMWLARDYLLKRLGFRADETNRRYTKTVTLDSGEQKEAVYVYSGPDNVIHRMLQKFLPWLVKKPGDTTPQVAQKMARGFINEMHPFWRMILNDYMRNMKADGTELINPYDPFPIQALDVIIYTTGSLIRMVEPVVTLGQDETLPKAQLRQVLDRDANKFDKYILSHLFSMYLRGIPEKKIQSDINSQAREFKYLLKRQVRGRQGLTPEQQNQWLIRAKIVHENAIKKREYYNKQYGQGGQ